jgi:hypothetical protein
VSFPFEDESQFELSSTAESHAMASRAASIASASFANSLPEE